MIKKALSITLALVMALGIMCIPVSSLDATPTASTVLVNGNNVAFDAYLIEGNNYFKLRDLAYTLNGTAKQFSVGWDGDNNAISLTSGQVYTAVGGEMEGKGSGTKTPTPTTSKIIKDGKKVQFTAYLIDGNNYFKLRDIGAAFDFGVNWDGAKNAIVIDTNKDYTPEQTLAEKYFLITMEDGEGNDWLGFFRMMAEMDPENGEFVLDSLYLELQSGGTCLIAITGEEAEKGTYTIKGNTITITVGKDVLVGTIEENTIIIEQDGDDGLLRMVFEQK